ncbi:hypothetical protein SAMN06309944_1361 [Micrococcales bacterium KH10]|nr:hypothetical protein SAMN06309944_1361 [Micrococcales bacterium KH10]
MTSLPQTGRGTGVLTVDNQLGSFLAMDRDSLTGEISTQWSWKTPLIVLAVVFAVVAAIIASWAIPSYAAYASRSSLTHEEVQKFARDLVDTTLSDSPELICVDTADPNRCLWNLAEYKDLMPSAHADVVCVWEIPDSGSNWAVAYRGTTGDNKAFTTYQRYYREQGTMHGNRVFWMPYNTPPEGAQTVTDDGVSCG